MEKDKIFELVQKYINSIPVILLGSGASAPYGIATMSMLAIELKKNLAGFTAPEDTECIQKFIQELDKHNDLEQALLAIKATANVEKRIQEVTWKLINQGDTQVLNKIQQFERLGLTSLFEHLINHTSNRRIDIITTNYDRLAEYAASQTQAFVNTGFTHCLIGNFMDDQTMEHYCQLKDYIGLINIWKVHGSLDWFHREGNILCYQNSTYIPINHTPSIITPGTNKYEKSLENPWRTIMQRVDQSFKQATAFLCIGYGFNDNHIHPKLIERIKAKVPLIVITKLMSPKAHELIQKNSEKYIILEETDGKTLVSTPDSPDGVKLDGNYWTIDGLMKILE